VGFTRAGSNPAPGTIKDSSVRISSPHGKLCSSFSDTRGTHAIGMFSYCLSLSFPYNGREVAFWVNTLVQEQRTIRIFLVDDNRFLLESLVFLLRRQGDFEVVGVSLKGKGLLGQLEKVKPDVILLDVRLEDSDGVVVLRKIREKLGIPVVMMSAYEEYRKRALESGASAYIVKGGDPFELYRALRRAVQHQ